MMTELIDQADLVTPTELTDPQKDPTHSRQSLRLQLIEDLSYKDVKRCYRGSTVSKYNSQYHKLFSAVPKEEILMKVYSCALLRDILLQGRLYISPNWLCFYANLFGKDSKVCVPVGSVQLVKKHKTAGLVPNGLVISTDRGQKSHTEGIKGYLSKKESDGVLRQTWPPQSPDLNPIQMV